MKRNERGMTLLEVMVAVVILGIVVMQMSVVPLMSLSAIRRSQGAARATAAARDKVEELQNLIARSHQGFCGYDTLNLVYNGGWVSDSVNTVDGVVYRRTTVQFPGGFDTLGFVGATIQCSVVIGRRPQVFVFNTNLAQRDSLPGFRP